MIHGLGARTQVPLAATRGAARLLAVDDGGDTVRFAAPARRIVSLNPATTEILFAIGAGDRLVGRTDACDYPAAAARVPSVGGGLPPNLEAVAARAPDLVVLYYGSTTAESAKRLRELNIPVLALRTDHLADVSRVARVLGPVAGAARAADSLAAAFDSALALARRGSHPADAPGVLLLAWDQPLIVLGRGSFVSELVELAGARNVYDDLASSSAPVSLEAVVERAPRAVLTLSGMSAGFAERPEWRVVPAVRAGRVLALTASALNRPSPRAAAAIAALRQRLDSVLR
ncbi:MAG TPA: helical backbone metal receptor [Gemmatimonadales bacterium]|nr:helical backbone metal receptor [Gemmatimonadales bacterium]